MSLTQPLLAPQQILLKNKGRISGKESWKNNLNLAVLAGSKIGTSLGPRGAYKLVTYSRGPEMVMKVTKDPVDVLSEMGVEYPAMMTLAEAAKIQREHTGDGVSSLIVLVSALLAEADKLIEMGFHPNTILDGYLKATQESIKIVNDLAREIEDVSSEKLLEAIDCGSGLLDKQFRQELSEAINRIAEDGAVDTSRVRLIKKVGGQTNESQLVRGVIIQKGKAHPSMPDRVEDPRIAFLSKIAFKHLELKAKDSGPFNFKLNITTPAQVEEFKAEENRIRSLLVEEILQSGANVVICKTKMDDRICDMLSRHGIFAVNFVDNPEFEAAARATGGTIVGSVDQLEEKDLGKARNLQVDKIKPEDVVVLECDGGATLLLRGSSQTILQELEKMAKKALLILKHSRVNPKVVPGGGATLVEAARRTRKYALEFSGREQFVISSFADALEKIPEYLAWNYGLDPIDTMIQLRNDHASGRENIGVGEMGPVDMVDAGVLELGSVMRANLNRVFELVSLLLRIDDYIFAKEIPKFHKQ